eukprot:TRINITY_DN12420_c0_g1_i1.p1 TRINITY_DN12420_c0_g1~~TRINITY_DN12420_c0_g1_i1.p1  ORF type:complete len:391 (+),score=59.76 TRINITY_DN12420_c0_g1_i1:85-1257(+)
MGGGKNKKVSAKVMKNKSAEAWEVAKAKKKIHRSVSDLPIEALLHALSFLTKKAGGHSYTLPEGRLHNTIDLNLVCKAWYVALETKRHEIPEGLGLETFIRKILKEKMLKSTPSPPQAPTSPPSTNPHVLILTKLTEPPPQDSHDQENLTMDDVKELIKMFVETGGCKTWMVHMLMRLFKIQRCSIEVNRRTHFSNSKASSNTKKAAASRVNEFVKWAFREFELDPLVVDCNHRGFLHYAAILKDASMARFFFSLDKSVVLCCDRHGQTPLHIAAHTGSLEICQLLLAKPDDARPCSNFVNKKDKNGCTALDVAQKRKHASCAQAISKETRSSLYRDERCKDDEGVVKNKSVAPNPKGVPAAKPSGKQQKKAGYFDPAEERALSFEDKYW